MSDTIRIEVLEDGTLKVETGKISAANHGGAEMLIRELVKVMGGEVERERIGVHVHTHGGVTHEH